jgi:hypothetical protein
MSICIICRLEKENFNDEHVIPDSILGYYHIYTVCTDCNSKLGHTIDNKITTHKLIEFVRNALNIPGKSGKVPNPFIGTFESKNFPGQKVHFRPGKSGKLEPTVVQSGSFDEQTNVFSITFDKSELANREKIIEKFLERNGYTRDMVHSESLIEISERPVLEGKFSFDIRDHKIAILKMAYEFTVTNVSNYFSDPQAKIISEVLLNADYGLMDEKVTFLSDGTDSKIFNFLSPYIDLSSNNHFMVLMDSDKGLMCLIKIFDLFYVAISMSDIEYFLPEIIILKNDIENRNAKIYSFAELFSTVYDKPEYRFEYHFESSQAADEFAIDEAKENFGFYYRDHNIPLFKSNGDIAYSDIELKLKKEDGNSENIYLPDKIIFKYSMDEELYIKIDPSEKLVRILSINEEMKLINKL